VVARLAVVGALVAGLSACGGALPAEDVADAVAVAFDSDLGFRPEVTCPADLDAEVGATVRCTASVDGETYGATVAVTSVEGDEAEFEVQVDEEPQA
jgi:hypothetical protein